MAERFIRAKELCTITGLSRSTLWRLERAGGFPSRRKISAGTVGWMFSEVLEWMESRRQAA